MRRSTIERSCRKAGKPVPPHGAISFGSGSDTVFDLDHPENPVRWRFGRDGKLKAFIVYTKTDNHHLPWRPITDSAEKEAVVSSLFSQQGA
jgi:hypothetical protein